MTRHAGSGAMSRRAFLAAAGAGAAGVLLGGRRLARAAATEAGPVVAGTPRPNVIVIVADDLGYADLGVQGCRDIPTPHIDSLAQAGVRFTNGYVSCPVCSPTRAGLQTGRYQQRFGHEQNPGPADYMSPQFGLPLSERTMADRFKALGYATALVGKWHLGSRPEFHPRKRGFDEFFGFLGGAHSYTDLKRTIPQPIMRNEEPVGEREYLTDALSREAAAFIDRHRGDPFFLCLTYNAVHTPLEAPADRIARFASIRDSSRRTFAAMLSSMDDGVGRVLGRLREHGLEERTLVVFLSDNGGPTDVNTSINAPLSGTKGRVLEGGIRVPFLMQWKSRLSAAKVVDAPVISLDILPTAAAAAGAVAAPDWKLDGVNLLPFLTGEAKAIPHETLYWRYGQQTAIRSGDWKLLRLPKDPAPRLFNLAEDIGEQKDLAASAPERVTALQATYNAWNAELVEPRWRAEPGQQRKNAKGRP